MSKIKYINIKKVHSAIGRNKIQKLTLLGLGLKKLGAVCKVQDTASIRGMMNKVKHLIKIVG